MKRVVVERYGGPEVLRVVEEDDPRPGVGEVRVRVLAAGVSFPRHPTIYFFARCYCTVANSAP